MKIEIVKAQKANLLEVLYIIKEGSRQLLEKGVKYWNNSLADYHEISRDIELGHIYLIKYNHVAVGTVTLRINSDKGTLQIERLAIFPTFQKKGLANKLIDFAKMLANDNRINTIIGTIPVNDTELINLLEKNKFVRKDENQISYSPENMAIEFEFKS